MGVPNYFLVIFQLLKINIEKAVKDLAVWPCDEIASRGDAVLPVRFLAVKRGGRGEGRSRRGRMNQYVFITRKVKRPGHCCTGRFC
jgi:hypothetical protein